MQNKNAYTVSFPEIALEKIQDDFDSKLKNSIKEKLKKVIEDVREDIELQYYTNYSNNLDHYLNDLAIDKARAIVKGFLENDQSSLRYFLDFDNLTREKVLESVIDYAAKTEIEKLKRENACLTERLELARSYR